jgi:hypothetical protein
MPTSFDSPYLVEMFLCAGSARFAASLKIERLME